MLVKSLRLENFRQFKGTTKVEFSMDPEKNVTIILGNNTFGKTTLLQAFNWCFYGEALLENPNRLLNLDVASEMLEGQFNNVEVEIVVLHKDLEYVITRTQRYTIANSNLHGEIPQVKVSYKQPDGQTESVRAIEVDNVINSILPKNLSTYFFFDTERVNSISDRGDVAEAVRGLMGLTVLENARAHIGSRTNKSTVIGKWYSSMDADGDQKAQSALTSIQNAEANRASISEQIKECESQIESFEDRKKMLDDVLRENQETTALQKQKEKLERDLSAEKSALDDYMSQFFKQFSRGSFAFFSQPLLSLADSFLKEVKVDDKGVRDLTKPTIEEIIKRGHCICGAEICAGNDAYKHLMDELAYVPPESIGNTVRHYREKLNSVSRSSIHFFENIDNIYKQTLRSSYRISEYEDELQQISSKIKGKANMRQNEQDLIDVKKRLRELQDKRDRLIREDETLKNSISGYQKVYDSLTAVSDKNKELLALIDYAEEISGWLAKTYTEKEAAIRDALETKVNTLFSRMYHGQRRVSIDSKYQVTLLTTIAEKEIAAGESEGSNRVKNFAFIAGLVALAKDKIVTENGSIDLSAEPYPLVMDAPFSNADETHTANISKVLPEIADQVIMFVMQKDWTYAERVMSSRVGQKYYLNKISETYTKLQ